MEGTFIYWALAVAGLLMLIMFRRSAKWLLRLGFYFILGGLLLLVVNWVLSDFGIQLAINPVTMLTAGILQVPGIVLLIILNYVFL